MAVLPPRDSGSVASIQAVLPVASPAYVLLVRQAGTRDQPPPKNVCIRGAVTSNYYVFMFITFYELSHIFLI